MALRFLAACLLAGLPFHAHPQGYPTKTVKIVAPVQPGGGVDLVARTMANRYSRALGATFIVENISGGGGSIASQSVARAAPDGYIAPGLTDLTGGQTQMMTPGLAAAIGADIARWTKLARDRKIELVD